MEFVVFMLAFFLIVAIAAYVSRGIDLARTRNLADGRLAVIDRQGGELAELRQTIADATARADPAAKAGDDEDADGGNPINILDDEVGELATRIDGHDERFGLLDTRTKELLAGLDAIRPHQIEAQIRALHRRLDESEKLTAGVQAAHRHSDQVDADHELRLRKLESLAALAALGRERDLVVRSPEFRPPLYTPPAADAPVLDTAAAPAEPDEPDEPPC